MSCWGRVPRHSTPRRATGPPSGAAWPLLGGRTRAQRTCRPGRAGVARGGNVVLPQDVWERMENAEGSDSRLVMSCVRVRLSHRLVSKGESQRAQEAFDLGQIRRQHDFGLRVRQVTKAAKILLAEAQPHCVRSPFDRDGRRHGLDRFRGRGSDRLDRVRPPLRLIDPAPRGRLLRGRRLGRIVDLPLTGCSNPSYCPSDARSAAAIDHAHAVIDPALAARDRAHASTGPARAPSAPAPLAAARGLRRGAGPAPHDRRQWGARAHRPRESYGRLAPIVQVQNFGSKRSTR